jgi:soluble lytic murein transglycosylase-like protein
MRRTSRPLILLALFPLIHLPADILTEQSHALYGGSIKTPSTQGIPLEYQFAMVRYSEETGVPLWFMTRLVEWESGWDCRAVNANKKSKYHPASVDRGLLMLNSIYLDDFSFRFNDGVKIDPTDPVTSIRVGFRKMAGLLKRCKNDYRKALILWNGAGNMKSLPDGTRAMIKGVLDE